MKIALMNLILLVVAAGCSSNSEATEDVQKKNNDSVQARAQQYAEHPEENLLFERPSTTAHLKETGSAGSSMLLFYPRITKLTGTVSRDCGVMEAYQYYLTTDGGKFFALNIPKPPKGWLNKTFEVTGVRLTTTAEDEKYRRKLTKESPSGEPLPKSPVEGVLHDVSFELADGKDAAKSDSAVTPTLIFEPRITKLRGTVIRDYYVEKAYKYFLKTRDGRLIALKIFSPPEGGLDKTYEVTGVRLVTPTATKEKYRREAMKEMLPGQSLPESPIEYVLRDVSLVLVED